MQTFLYTFLGIITGGIITYLVSKFYYKKTVKTKELSAFVQFITEILSDIDPQVKKKLEVSYNSQSVDKLYQMQFVIANTGDLPVTNVIEPLTIELPNNGIVFDVNIIHIEPLGRKVSYKIISSENETGNSVIFDFPLLNSGEYFVSKLLIKGEPPRKVKIEKDTKESSVASLETANEMFEEYETLSVYSKYSFKITADDIPPNIKACKLPYSYFENEKPDKMDFSGIIAGTIFAFFAFSLGYFFYSLKESIPTLFIFHIGEFITNFSFLSITVILGWLLALACLLIAIIIVTIGLDEFKPRKKPKFLLPKKLRDYKTSRWDF